MMDNVIFLILRRMRRPLITLVVIYSLAIIGLVLIPGRLPDGTIWRMDIFHAFYFVSFMSTTIGFGEVPHEFSDPQRMWVTLSIYASVIGWLYSIGTLLGLLQDKAFKQALTELRFEKRIRNLKENFFLICGYGETGASLAREMTDRGKHIVVLDRSEDAINMMKMANLREDVPALAVDARIPQALVEAGLENASCRGVIAVTNDSEANLKIALTAKLLNPATTVICRAESRAVEANMASFGTDHIIDPFETFALHLSTALQSPCLYLLLQWLAGSRHGRLSEPIYPPRDGNWVLCGYGRFGKSVYRRLNQEGVDITVIEASPELTGRSKGRFVEGIGTEAVTLEEADIEHAVGLVAGTDNDVNNLSIIMTARMLNPKLFVILRQNLVENESIAHKVGADIVMYPSAIVASRIRSLLVTPLLSLFISQASSEDDPWACKVVSRISGVTGSRPPEVWELEINDEQAHAVYQHIGQGEPLMLRHLLLDPRDRDLRLDCIPLLLVRAQSQQAMPEPDTKLRKGDQLLFCGRNRARRRMEWTLLNEHALAYVMDDASDHRTVLGNWLAAMGWR